MKKSNKDFRRQKPAPQNLITVRNSIDLTEQPKERRYTAA